MLIYADYSGAFLGPDGQHCRYQLRVVPMLEDGQPLVFSVSGSIDRLDLDEFPILITKKRVVALPFDGLSGPSQRLLECRLMHWIARKEV